MIFRCSDWRYMTAEAGAGAGVIQEVFGLGVGGGVGRRDASARYAHRLSHSARSNSLV